MLTFVLPSALKKAANIVYRHHTITATQLQVRSTIYRSKKLQNTKMESLNLNNYYPENYNKNISKIKQKGKI